MGHIIFTSEFYDSLVFACQDLKYLEENGMLSLTFGSDQNK